MDIARLRLHNQMLSRPLQGQPEDAVKQLVAMQAQDYFGALWAVGIRMAKGTARDVEDAFMEGRILRTHVMRPTWHFVAPEDIRWLAKLTAPSVHQANAHIYRQQKLDGKVFHKANEIIAKTLTRRNYLTRGELQQAFKQSGIEATGIRLAYILMQAELEALICSGPRQDKQFTYALLDERAPTRKRPPNMDEALSGFMHRFFTSRGPATVNDFAYWSGLKLAQAKAGLESLKQALQRERIDGKEYWVSTPHGKVSRAAGAFLLSNYDEYGMSYKDKGTFVYKDKVGQLFDYAYSHLIILNGDVAGSWRRERTKDGITIHLRPINQPSKQEMKLIKKAAERYEKFLGQTVRLEF